MDIPIEDTLTNDDILAQYSRFPQTGEAYRYILHVLTLRVEKEAQAGRVVSRICLTWRNEMLWGELHLICHIDKLEFE